MSSILNILIVEDNQFDADLILRELTRSKLNFNSEIVKTSEQFENALNTFKPQIVLSDYSLPSFDGVTAFQIKESLCPSIPFIIVSGVIGEENAVALIKSGVTDFVSKDKLFTLSQRIARALKETEEREERKIVSEQLKAQTEELMVANKELIKQEQMVKNINHELVLLNTELEERVSERTKALSESESLFRNMMETISQMAWTVTVKAQASFFNKQWYSYTGMDREQAKEHVWDLITHPDDLQQSSEPSHLIKDGERTEWTGEVRYRRADGVFRWHLVSILPIMDEKDEIHLWIGTATDIHDLKILQEQKDDFISIASHELKTPITSLTASLQLLNKMKDDPTAKMLPSLIDMSNKSLNKLNLLIKNLLNVTQFNNGQLHLTKSWVNMSKLIQDCCPEIRAEGIYKIRTVGDLNLKVYADAPRIDQVLVNFVNNALKYAPSSKDILITISNAKNMVKVSITDTGQGIAADKIPYLFDRYFRVDSTGNQYSGLGLGLYISGQIIEKHNGEIGADSEVGKGSTFWFTLPINQEAQLN
jgi:PAS domain S-box-containing protein